jgi:hypothetical protein
MRFQLELPDDIGAIVDEIRENDPLRPSRRQQYTKIVIEWLEANGYLQGNRERESEKERKRRELQEEFRRRMAELETQ